jgi:hypothetical protein
MYGWSEADMQLLLEGRAAEAWYQPVPGAGLAEQASEDTAALWLLHRQLSEALTAAAPPRLKEAAALGPDGMREVEQIEQKVSHVVHSCIGRAG